MNNEVERSRSTKATPWAPPDQQLLIQGLDQRRARMPDTVFRSITFRLFNPGVRKTNTLIWTFTHTQNLAVAVLEALRETPETPRNNGALACILEMLSRKAQGATGARSVLLADILSECFFGGKARKISLSSKKPQIIKNRLVTGRLFSAQEYPITGELRSAVLREIAVPLLNWYLKIMNQEDDSSENGRRFPSRKRKKHTKGEIIVPDLSVVHERWASRVREYDQAAAAIIPFGRYRGKTLRQVGKREVRWIQERMISKVQIEETLGHVAALLQPSLCTPETLRKARQARHPWRRKVEREQVPQGSRIVQRSLNMRQPLIRLQTLNVQELERLQNELHELLDFAVHFATLRIHVDRFLGAAPPRYPTVKAVLDNSGYEAVLAEYEQALTSLSSTVLAIEKQQEVETQLLRAESALGRPSFLPLRFLRTMIPPRSLDSFALLFSASTPEEEQLKKKYRGMSRSRREKKIAAVLENGPIYKYVLAIAVHGQYAFKGPNPMERVTPTVRPGLYYVNFPETPFHVSEDSSILLFPLECGEKYHEQTFLRRIIDQQRAAQHTMFDQKRLAGEEVTSAAECFPKTAIASARLLCKSTVNNEYQFFLSVPIGTPALATTEGSTRVLGIHENPHGYSYSVLESDGGVVAQGHVPIKPHVLPKPGDRAYSDNYVYDVANACVTLAAHHNALIGLEHTVWKKQRAQVDRTANRILFARPSAKLESTLQYKAHLAGLLTPVSTWGVSDRVCSRCNTKQGPGWRLKHPPIENCYICNTSSLSETEVTGMKECTKCHSRWYCHEPLFICEG